MGVFRRTAKTLYRRGKKAVKKRYGLNKKSTGPMAGTMLRDGMSVANMARKAYQMVNSELKTAIQPTINAQIGQVNVNASGSYVIDISPYQVGQNLTATGRTGNSIKLKSSYFEFQFGQQSAATIGSKIIIELWAIKGVPEDYTTLLTTTVPRIFDNATFSSVIDAFSPRNQNSYNDYVCLRRKKVSIPFEQVTGTSPLKTVMFGHKWNKGYGHHVRFKGDSGTGNDIANGQIILTMRADTGNSGATASSRIVYQFAPNTGTNFLYTHKHYYYDN